jgi:hypothetical protein
MSATTEAAEPPDDPPGDRFRGAARRSAGRSIRIQRMPYGTVRGIFVGRAEGELMEIRLAEDHRSGFPQARHHRRVGRGDVLLPHLRCSGRAHAFDVDEILE